jgi:hypothetical protein
MRRVIFFFVFLERDNLDYLDSVLILKLYSLLMH